MVKTTKASFFGGPHRAVPKFARRGETEHIRLFRLLETNNDEGEGELYRAHAAVDPPEG
jgi:hypothetical protein